MTCVRKLYPPWCQSGCPQRAEGCTTNAWKGSAAGISNLSGLWGATFCVQWAWVGRWVGDGVQTGGGDLPEDHSHQLRTVTCPASCTCSTWLLRHGGLKAAFTSPEEAYRVFCFCVLCAYTRMDAEITFPVCFFPAACPCPFTSSLERAPAYVTHPLTQSAYGSTQITCNV